VVNSWKSILFEAENSLINLVREGYWPAVKYLLEARITVESHMNFGAPPASRIFSTLCASCADKLLLALGSEERFVAEGKTHGVGKDQHTI